MITAIIFDLDNTLVDFTRLKKKGSYAAAKAMVKAGLKMPVRKAEKQLYNFYQDDIEGNHVFEHFLKKHHIHSDKILAAAVNAYVAVKAHDLKPFPKVKETLRKLKKKGLKLAVVTDAHRYKAYSRLDAMKLTDFFSVVVGFDDTHQLKPSSKPFKRALRLLKVKPEECLMVGDWPTHDLLGAKRLGIKTCWAKYGAFKKFKHVKTDYTIGKFKNLLHIIDGDFE